MNNLTLCVLLLSSFLQPFSLRPSSPEPRHQIRVAVVQKADNVVLSIRGKYKLVNQKTNGLLSSGRALRNSRVQAGPKGIHVGQQFYPCHRLRILAQKDVMIRNGKKSQRFRGVIDIISDKNQKLLVVNTLDLEIYIKGVLYHEVSYRWPLEAIKAQAVAARTYAFYQSQVAGDGSEYDLTNDVYSQVYGGKSAERYRTSLAVDRTKNEFLKYKGEILPAYFHSSCGGHTEEARELWKHDLPPLAGVRCVFCRKAPHYRWKKNFRSKDVQERLNKNGYSIDLIKEIRIVERDRSRRIRKLVILTRNGRREMISGKTFRDILGPNELKSNYYKIEMKGYYFDVYGRGWGHGVGMCQWGAFFMSKQRYDYKEILKHYYPGAEIVKD